MAHSRPPPLRVQTVAASPPPVSPRTSEKKHHSRRKSGRDSTVPEKKASRPAPLARKTTPTQSATKAAPASTSRSARGAERDRDDEDQLRESFPQYCMTCEKQFLPVSNTLLYCSEACRVHDQAPSQPQRNNSYPSYPPTSPPLTPYTRHFSQPSPTNELPDIIPRFSPTQARPRSYFNSGPYPQNYRGPSTVSPYPTHNHTPSGSSTALASLRELATALPKITGRHSPSSPPSSISRTSSAVWNYIPFASKAPTPSATPGSSYTNMSNQASQSYVSLNRAGSKEDLYLYGNPAPVAGYGSTGGMGMDRPLPPRGGPGGYGHRPRSIDLVTPFSGH